MNDSPSQNLTGTMRSPLLMNPFDSAVVIIDIQEKLLPHIANHEKLLWNVRRMMDGARELRVPIHITEQYPRGLGPTVPPILEKHQLHSPVEIFEKTMFSCRQCQSLMDQLQEASVQTILLVGMETHVCVMQSALDLMAFGFDVSIGVDAVGSRFEIDHQIALRRLELSGATLVTTEMVLFEWCEVSGTDQFRRISQIVREPFDQ